MKSVQIVHPKGKRKLVQPVKFQEIQQNLVKDVDGKTIDSQHMLISMLLPSAVKAFLEELESEVETICGCRYGHGGEVMARWGHQRGSVIIGNQKVAIEKPRVRNTERAQEVPLTTYARFQDPKCFDDAVFNEGIKHVSQRDFEKGLPKIAASFGVSKSTVSRSWVKTTAKHLKTLLSRSLQPLKIVAIFIDGKRFSKLGVVIALGVGADGRKHVLGIYESSSENSGACLRLLEDLEQRGLPTQDLLFVVDGGSGLNKALNEKYDMHHPDKCRAVRVRCYVHKWHNLKAVLSETAQNEVKPLFWALRDAKDMSVAKTCSAALESCLQRHNGSALKSYLEAKDDLLAIHRLQISSHLKKFFSTTNPIESLNYLLEEDLRRVKRWRNSEHFRRWLATACAHNEKRMRKIRGYSGLPALTVRLQALCTHEDAQTTVDNIGAAA